MSKTKAELIINEIARLNIELKPKNQIIKIIKSNKKEPSRESNPNHFYYKLTNTLTHDTLYFDTIWHVRNHIAAN